LETLGGRLDAELIDLSQSGARVQIEGDERPQAAVLRLLGFAAYGDIIWNDESLLGMAFDPPLPAEQILQTREIAPSIVADGDGRSAAAKAFAQGDNRWR
jgi:hypothetical protein